MNEQFAGAGIGTLCGLFGKSRQAWYDANWKDEYRVEEHSVIIEFVRLIRRDMSRIGCHKLFDLFQKMKPKPELCIGRDKFFDVLRSYGMMLRNRRRKYARTTFSDHWMKKYSNLIKEFVPQQAGQLWVSDITYLTTTRGFVYLSLVTDAYSHKIMGWHLNRTLSAEGCFKALEMAFSAGIPANGLIHHSDRGIQYCSKLYVDMLQINQVAISMTQNGDPRENAIAERVNGILKGEFDLDSIFAGYTIADKAVKKAIYVYNNKRPHASCDYFTPEQAHLKTGILPKRWKNYYYTKQNAAPTT